MNEHEHLHLFEDGLQSFVHSHHRPVNELDKLAARPHAHINGEHSHPHGHKSYRLLPTDHGKRPIIARNDENTS